MRNLCRIVTVATQLLVLCRAQFDSGEGLALAPIRHQPSITVAILLWSPMITCAIEVRCPFTKINSQIRQLIETCTFYVHLGRRRSTSPMALSMCDGASLISSSLGDSLHGVSHPPLFTGNKAEPFGRSFKRRMSLAIQQNCPQKPPRVFVFTGDDLQLYHRLEAAIQACLIDDAYTLHRLTPEGLSQVFIPF